jgi:hypothetical protein
MKDKVKSLALRLGESLLFAAASTAVVSIVSHGMNKVLKEKQRVEDSEDKD